MSASVINPARFRACLELQRRGAKAGEREAARAAASRVAAGGGLDLAEAVRLADKADASTRPGACPRPAQRKSKAARAQPAPPPRSKPTTFAELLAEREAKAERQTRETHAAH